MERVFVIQNESMGNGDMELGKKLIGAFLRKLWAQESKPDMIILYNGGVKLLAKNSAVLEVLDGLFESGVDIMACGTCIEHYGLNDQIQVGRISNMEEIVSVMMKAEHVITI